MVWTFSLLLSSSCSSRWWNGPSRSWSRSRRSCAAKRSSRPKCVVRPTPKSSGQCRWNGTLLQHGSISLCVALVFQAGQVGRGPPPARHPGGRGRGRGHPPQGRGRVVRHRGQGQGRGRANGQKGRRLPRVPRGRQDRHAPRHAAQGTTP